MKKIWIYTTVLIIFALLTMGASGCGGVDTIAPNSGKTVEEMYAKWGDFFVWQNMPNGRFTVFQYGTPVFAVSLDPCDAARNDQQAVNLDPDDYLGDVYGLWAHNMTKGVIIQLTVNHNPVRELNFINYDESIYECPLSDPLYQNP